MMRVWPCELPRSWPRANCSRARTRRPRRASSQAAAESMPPTPMTITSNELVPIVVPTTYRIRGELEQGQVALHFPVCHLAMVFIPLRILEPQKLVGNRPECFADHLIALQLA